MDVAHEWKIATSFTWTWMDFRNPQAVLVMQINRFLQIQQIISAIIWNFCLCDKPREINRKDTQ